MQICALAEGFMQPFLSLPISWYININIHFTTWSIEEYIVIPVLEIVPLWQCFCWNKLEVLPLFLNDLLVHHRLTPEFWKAALETSSTHLYSCKETYITLWG